MPPRLHAADLVLSKAGGLAVSEALAAGCPLLLVDVIPGQETGNADYVCDAGAGALAPGPVEALEVLCHWLADGGAGLRARAGVARRLGRPRAALDAAELAWQAAEAGATPAVNRRRRVRLVSLLRRVGRWPKGQE
jgi:1,2-diacylglycerol 3-beta-galactosyltransferase